jgi:5'-nucleotidase
MTVRRTLLAAVLATGASIGALVSSPAAARTPAKPLTILVTNDDGVSAPGIDAVVQALRHVKGVKVVVVAPATNQSGAGSKMTSGPVATHPATTASGYAATAVDGYPADSVNAALDQLGVQPKLVVSGVNNGQNLGPFTDLSGTVGAARQGAARGVPAVAASQGIGDPQFASAAALVVKWVSQHRAALLRARKTPTVPGVAVLNVPNCPGIATHPPYPTAPGPETEAGSALLSTVDCSRSTKRPADDVQAFNDGYAPLTQVPVTGPRTT